MYILYIPTCQTTTTNDIISLIQHSFLYPLEALKVKKKNGFTKTTIDFFAYYFY